MPDLAHEIGLHSFFQFLCSKKRASMPIFNIILVQHVVPNFSISSLPPPASSLQLQQSPLPVECQRCHLETSKFQARLIDNKLLCHGISLNRRPDTLSSL